MAGMAGMGGMGMSADQEAMIRKMEMEETLKTYNDTVYRCFGECVDSFRGKTLDGKEEACVRKCAEKFVKFSQRAQMRFGEKQQEMQQEMMQQMQK